MTAKSDRLNEYVRRAIRLDLGESADATALFQEITRRPVADRPAADRPAPQRRPAPHHRSTRRRIRFATVAAAGVVVALAVVAASTGVLGSGGHRPPVASDPTRAGQETAAPDRQGDPFGAGSAGSCVDPKRLPKPTFAFDGTVAGIGTSPPPDPATGPAVYVPVVFTVNQWFRGGSGATVTVVMPPPGPMTEDAPAYTIGSRLLVSGTDSSDNPQRKIAWTCGFTLWYDPADARAWERAGGYAPAGSTSRSRPSGG